MKHQLILICLLIIFGTFGAITDSYAQSAGSESYYICEWGVSPIPCDEEIDICACDSCDMQIDCEDREQHLLDHQLAQIDKIQAPNTESGGDSSGSGGNSSENGSNNNEGSTTVTIPEITTLPEVVITPNYDYENYPCFEFIKNTITYMPLANMELQPTKKGFKGATFGLTRIRNGEKREHRGIDFAASVGTEIYSIYDGIVTKIVDNQINRVWSDDVNDYIYPDNYTGDDNDAGNRIYIQSIVDGEIITMGYWHLQENKPLIGGISIGDSIYAGDIIGYVGLTGNAIGGKPHLHLSTQNSKSEFIDPQPYLGIKYDVNENNEIQSSILVLPCD